VIVRDELPRTATGKVQKYVLREQVQAALAPTQSRQIER
jgi:acyl-coenzyme A synthetase/AMP-(fatty) acid ligase